MKLLKDRRGNSKTFWTVFFGFIMISIMTMGIELGRYFYASADSLGGCSGDQSKDI